MAIFADAIDDHTTRQQESEITDQDAYKSQKSLLQEAQTLKNTCGSFLKRHECIQLMLRLAHESLPFSDCLTATLPDPRPRVTETVPIEPWGDMSLPDKITALNGWLESTIRRWKVDEKTLAGDVSWLELSQSVHENATIEQWKSDTKPA